MNASNSPLTITILLSLSINSLLHLHIEPIDGHDVEVAQLRGSDGEIGWNCIIFIDHQARHAPASLHRESLQIFRNVSLQVEFIHDMKVALRKEKIKSYQESAEINKHISQPVSPIANQTSLTRSLHIIHLVDIYKLILLSVHRSYP